MSKIYRINVVWSEWGVMEIKANNLKEAERKAIEEESLPDGNYVSGSITLDKDIDGYGENYNIED